MSRISLTRTRTAVRRTEAVQAVGGALGAGASLRTLIASEQFTSASYEAALEVIAQPEARALLSDEQRHLQALTQGLERSEREEERATA